MPAKAPRIDPELIHQQIQALYRDPFRAVLAHFLEAVPSVEDIHAFARKHPDRWAQAISIFSKAAGYSDKIVHEHNLLVQIEQMSDAEIKMRLEKLQHELLQEEAVDAELVTDDKLLPDSVEEGED